MTNLVPLGEIVDIKGGGTPDKKVQAYWDGDIPWASVKDFKSGVLDRTADRITSAGVAASATQVIPAGHIIVPTRMAVGKAAINTIDLAINQDLKALFPKPSVDTRYLYHALLGSSDKLLEQATGATVKGIKLNVLRGLKIPLPPLEEQKRIAGILDQAAELCRLRTRALYKLNTLGQAIFHEMFDGAQPVMEAVGNLGEVQGGLQVSRKRDAHERRAPYLRVANVYRDRLDLDEIKTISLTDAEAERTELQPGDVLIVEGHGNPDEIGRTAVWGGEIDSCVHQNHLIRFRPNQARIIPQFFSSYMNSITGRKHLTSSSRTTTGLNTISTKKVKECIIPVPDIDEQAAFLAVYARVERQDKKLMELVAKQESLFASLQHRAFRGEL
ncbi:restriction endonuclease subunit S [Allosediminivita pacifica]|uniref:Type I restriction enzyme S subunit n=1 Tax=Allosediminivita pacifica TaxID=1267769 RepID=A0A2T6ACM0_9RHOB|nr:restriction endonuclease subunit S [Allosediminivita pacifica]PTX41565.1 type I restriction enzyme S subunit [Allosediminivita pacifica]GGB22967.1 restriction modification system S chain-like protein [Allosediminivita pacifica]